jgi:photoactive yellow protein
MQAMSTDSDLYSFLRSKDFTEKEETLDTDAPKQDPAHETNDQESSSEAASDASTASETASAADISLSFDDPDLANKLHKCSDEQLDEAGFGIVKVDDDGIVLFYNEYEARHADVRPEEAMGKNFFTQVAPCSNNRIFRGRFKKGVMKGVLDESFTYTFTYKMRPTLVNVRMLRDDWSDNWVVIRFRVTSS